MTHDEHNALISQLQTLKIERPKGEVTIDKAIAALDLYRNALIEIEDKARGGYYALVAGEALGHGR